MRGLLLGCALLAVAGSLALPSATAADEVGPVVVGSGWDAGTPYTLVVADGCVELHAGGDYQQRCDLALAAGEAITAERLSAGGTTVVVALVGPGVDHLHMAYATGVAVGYGDLGEAVIGDARLLHLPYYGGSWPVMAIAAIDAADEEIGRAVP